MDEILILVGLAWFVIIVAWLVLNYYIATWMKEIAIDKGQEGISRRVWHLCFWLGMVGYIYVLALPSLTDRKLQEKIIDIMSIAHKSEVADEMEQRTKEAERLAAEERRKQEAIQRKEEEARRKEEERIQRAHEEQQAKEKEKQKRIEAYWNVHAEEKQALLDKKARALEKLDKMGSFAVEEREQLQKIIDAIDVELTKDREG